MADPYLSPAPYPQVYDVQPRRYWPYATFILLALNFVMFGLEIYAGGADNTSVLLNFGASLGPYFRRGEYWRLVMPIFLHGGWLHILSNSYALYMLGPILERVYGYGRYSLIYIASGMGGAFLSMSLSKNISVGASGAIFGIAGAMLVTGYAHRQAVPRRWGRAFGQGMVPFIILNLAIGFSVHGVDNWGHLGGLAVGSLLAFVIAPPQEHLSYGEASEQPSQAIVALPIAVVVLAFAATANHYRSSQAVQQLLEQAERFGSAHQDDRQLQSIQEALRRAPNNEQAHEDLGSFYLRQRKYDEAITEFSEAVRLSGGDDRARLALGLAYQLKGEPQKAQQLFEQTLGKNPKTEEGKRLLAANQTLLAELYAKQNFYADAIVRYKEALRLAPDLAEAQNNLAWLYATCDDPKFRNPKEAMDLATSAVKLTGWKDGNTIDTLAESYFANGDSRRAVSVEEKALALDPDNKEFQDHLERYRQAARM